MSRVDLRWLGRRALGALLTLAVVVVFNFFLFRVMGDPTTQLAHLPNAAPEEVERLRASYGLDQPVFPDQFLNYTGDLARLDLGIGQQTREPVVDLLADALPWTLLLVGTGTVLAMLLGTWLGVRAAVRRGKAADHGIVGTSLFAYSAPEYWTGLVLILLFAVALPLLPAGQQMTPGVEQGTLAQVGDVAKHLVLPAITFAVTLIGQYVLIMRSAMVGVLTEDFILAKRATGLPARQVVSRHALPNALLPLVTLSALQLGFVAGGAVTIETVFSWPGLGELTYQAVVDKDYPVLQGTFLVFAVAVIAANLVADTLYFVLDPRVQQA